VLRREERAPHLVPLRRREHRRRPLGEPSAGAAQDRDDGGEVLEEAGARAAVGGRLLGKRPPRPEKETGI